jgi:tripartite-type tricarboxylate transporter receptor subunit TctC
MKQLASRAHKISLRLTATPRQQCVNSSAVAALCIALLLGTTGELRAQANYFHGKVIRVIVGSSSGGGYDLWARLMAQHIGKHIPGNPTAVVQNMPGAGGVVAANYLYNIAKITSPNPTH